MRVSLPTLRLLLGTLTFLLLTACGGGGSSSSSSASEFDTLNLYFTENEIRSFNPTTGKSEYRADYDPGEHTLIPLDTDDDKQGYELVVYISDSTIKVMDYTDVKNPTDIATFDVNDEFCIFPQVSAAQTSFEGDKKGERILLNQTSILVTPRENGTCSKERDTINRIDFTSENNSISNITITEVNSSHLLGGTLLDFKHAPTTVTEEDKVGRYGFLGYDNAGEQLHFYSSESTTIWETALPNTSLVNAIPTIQQVTDKEVLIQQDGDLYLKDIAELFDVATTDSTTTPDIPSDSKVTALFENSSSLKLTEAALDKIQIASNGTEFALVDGTAVYIKKQDQTKFQRLVPKDISVQTLNIKMTDNGTLLAHRILSPKIHFRLENFVDTENPTTPLGIEINGEELKIDDPETDFGPDALESVINNNISLQSLNINAVSNETYLDIYAFTDTNIQVVVNGAGGDSIDVSEFDPNDSGSAALTQTLKSEQDITIEPTPSEPLETLSRININAATDTSIVQADKIVFETQDNNIYINTLSDSGWQAEWLDKNFERITFDKTIFVFAQNSRFASSKEDILLISPDKSFSQDGSTINPKLYAFDTSNKVTGRKRQDGEDFVFGEFSVDIQKVIESEVINDAFGRLELKSVRDNNEVTETYFFNPSEKDSHEEDTANKALLLIPPEE